MDLTCILYEKKGSVALVTLNRPDVLNAFNDEQSYELQSVFKDIKKDKEIRVVVLTGAGKAFCSGQDLKAIANSKNRSLSDSLYKRYNPQRVCAACSPHDAAIPMDFATVCDFHPLRDRSSHRLPPRRLSGLRSLVDRSPCHHRRPSQQ